MLVVRSRDAAAIQTGQWIKVFQVRNARRRVGDCYLAMGYGAWEETWARGPGWSCRLVHAGVVKTEEGHSAAPGGVGQGLLRKTLELIGNWQW